MGGKYLSFAVGRPREVAMPVVCAGQMGPPYSLFVWTIARLYASALLSLGYIHTFFIFQTKQKHTKLLLSCFLLYDNDLTMMRDLRVQAEAAYLRCGVLCISIAAGAAGDYKRCRPH